jgi:hypothetical protein
MIENTIRLAINPFVLFQGLILAWTRISKGKRNNVAPIVNRFRPNEKM